MDVKILKFIKNQSKNVKNILNQFKNVKIFFDNDVDGLMSCLIVFNSLKKLNKKVKCESIKEREKLGEIIKNLKNKNLLYIFLDLALKEEFLKIIRENEIKVLWIDHHKIEVFSTKGILYVNPLLISKKFYIPTSAITYLIFEKFAFIKENLFYAAIGIIADKGYEDCKSILKSASLKFGKNIEEFEILAKKVNSLFILNKEVEKFLNKFKNIKYFESKELEKSFEKVEKEIKKELKNFEKRKIKIKNFLIYKIKSKLKIRSTLASILAEKFKNEIIIICEEKRNKIRMSLRTNNQKIDLLEILKNLKINFINFGGHKNACGAVINKKDFKNFLNKIKWLK